MPSGTLVSTVVLEGVVPRPSISEAGPSNSVFTECLRCPPFCSSSVVISKLELCQDDAGVSAYSVTLGEVFVVPFWGESRKGDMGGSGLSPFSVD